jgi:hypothetical protein
MLIQIIRLELAKHKRSAISMVIIVLLSFVLIQFMPSFIKGYADYDVVGAGMTVLVVFGIPVLALAMGAMHAAALRREPEKSVEEALPVSPGRKLMGSYLASLFYFVGIALPFMLLYPSFIRVSAFGHMMDNIFALLISSSWWLALLLLHLQAFALTYWLKQPIMGGGLAGIAMVAQSTLMMATAWLLPSLQAQHYRLSYYYEWWQLSSVQTMVAATVVIAAFLLNFRGLILLARKLERGIHINFTTALKVVFMLFFGVVFALVLFLGFSGFSQDLDCCDAPNSTDRF